MYYLLTEKFTDQQTQLVKTILDVVPATHIYLLGSTLQQRRTETLFMPEAPSCRYVGHYYVLVLVDDTANCAVLENKLETSCRQYIPVTALVLHSHVFTEWLFAGHSFAVAVQQRAVLLHGEPISFHTVPATTGIAAPEKQKQQGGQQMKSFFAGAELYILRKEYKMAAFMLHQCAEQGLLALLKAGSGLHINTHNLDKLVRYCSMVNYRIADIFSQQNEQEERLFQLLQKAYIDTRYKENYQINRVELTAIKDMVAKLINMMEAS